MKYKTCLIVLMIVGVALIPSTAPSQGTVEKGKVEIHLAELHTPKDLKPGVRVQLVMILGSVRTKTGKVMYQSKSIANNAEVITVNRPKKPGDPKRPVVVELLVPKSEVVRIEKAKSQTVSIVESKGGKVETKKQPIPLRLELLPMGKK